MNKRRTTDEYSKSIKQYEKQLAKKPQAYQELLYKDIIKLKKDDPSSVGEYKTYLFDNYTTSIILNSKGINLDFFTFVENNDNYYDVYRKKKSILLDKYMGFNDEFFYVVAERKLTLSKLADQLPLPFLLSKTQRKINDHQYDDTNLFNRCPLTLMNAQVELIDKQFATMKDFHDILNKSDMMDDEYDSQKMNLRSCMAINQHLSEDMMLSFVHKSALNSSSVRQSLALNPNLTSKILRFLVSDEDKTVLFLVAKHKNTDHWCLLKLLNDESPIVRRWAASNPNLDIKDLMNWSEWDDDVARGLVMRSDISMDFVEKLWKKCNVSVKFNIAYISTLPNAVKELYQIMFFSDDNLTHSVAITPGKVVSSGINELYATKGTSKSLHYPFVSYR